MAIRQFEDEYLEFICKTWALNQAFSLVWISITFFLTIIVYIYHTSSNERTLCKKTMTTKWWKWDKQYGLIKETKGIILFHNRLCMFQPFS